MNFVLDSVKNIEEQRETAVNQRQYCCLFNSIESVCRRQIKAGSKDESCFKLDIKYCMKSLKNLRGVRYSSCCVMCTRRIKCYSVLFCSDELSTGAVHCNKYGDMNPSITKHYKT